MTGIGCGWDLQIINYRGLVALHQNDGMQYPGIIWQRNYLERIIHPKQDLVAANKYIINNPIKAANARNSNNTEKK